MLRDLKAMVAAIDRRRKRTLVIIGLCHGTGTLRTAHLSSLCMFSLTRLCEPRREKTGLRGYQPGLTQNSNQSVQ